MSRRVESRTQTAELLAWRRSKEEEDAVGAEIEALHAQTTQVL